MAHILIVEPDITLGKTYAAALEAAGHSVAHSQSAQAAIHDADDQLPALVVLELELPIHNGVEFLYEFRSYPEWRSVAVLILSNTPPTQEGLQPDSWPRLGIAGYCYKPATKLKSLTKIVDDLLAVNVRTA